MRTDALVPRHFRGFLAGKVWAVLALCVLSAASFSRAQEISPVPPASTDEEFPHNVTDSLGPAGLPEPPAPGTTIGGYRIPDVTDRENISAALQLIILLTVLSLAPAILIMTTCFTRIIIVLSLLRQALGTQQLPPNQIVIGLSMFMTFLVMGPTWQRVNTDALKPYLDGAIGPKMALEKAQIPMREFMILQIRKSGNDEDVRVFHGFANGKGKEAPQNWSEIDTTTLIPTFMLSELKTSFLMGFKIYLPFLIIDIVISTILISMGMMMLPPVMISLPFKLLLFVLVDGWRLITVNLMGSFA